MEFLVAGATAVQIGTANYYDPTVSQRLVEQLPAALAEAGVRRVADLVKTLQTPARPGGRLTRCAEEAQAPRDAVGYLVCDHGHWKSSN